MQLDKTKICSTLSECSKDDAGQSLIESAQMVYNFDEITKEIADVYRGGKPMASCDALYQKDAEHIYLIEFKNARKSRIGKKFFLQKAYDSVWTLAFAFYPELSLTELCQRLFLIVVYNEEGAEQKEEESEYFQAIKKKVGGWAGNRARILFGLEIYKDVLYKEILTVDKDEFMEKKYSELFD